MEEKKILRVGQAYSLEEAFNLYNQGIYIKDIILDEDADTLDEKYSILLDDYTLNMQTGNLEYDISINDYELEPSIGSIDLEDRKYEVSNIEHDELGYSIEATSGEIFDYELNFIFENNKEYHDYKRELLNKIKTKGIDIVTNTFAVTAASLARVGLSGINVKARKMPDIEEQLKNGLYHFTSENTANKIMESGYIKKSGMIASYGLIKKSFFFSDNLNLDDIKSNLPTKYIDNVMTAIHVKYNEALQRDIDSGKIEVRLDDGAITIVGDTKEEYGYEFEKVKMQLVKDNERSYYKDVTNKDLTQEELDSIENVNKELSRYKKMPPIIRETAFFWNTAKNRINNIVNGIKKIEKTPQMLPSKKEDEYINSEKISDELNLENHIYNDNDVHENYTNNSNEHGINKEMDERGIN